LWKNELWGIHAEPIGWIFAQLIIARKEDKKGLFR
jgi:hypothetical protein